MSLLSPNSTLFQLQAAAPVIMSNTRTALRAARHDRWSTRPGFVGIGGISYVVDTPVLPVSEATFERVLDEEQRDGVRLRLERRRGSRVAVIDLALRQTWSFVWMYDYVLAGTADGDLCFVPRCDAGPVIEISDGALRRRERGTGDNDRLLSLEVGERFLSSLIRGR